MIEGLPPEELQSELHRVMARHRRLFKIVKFEFIELSLACRGGGSYISLTIVPTSKRGLSSGNCKIEYNRETGIVKCCSDPHLVGQGPINKQCKIGSI